MKTVFSILALTIITLSANAANATSATDAFNKLKTLAGIWELSSSEFKKESLVSYEVISNGHSIIQKHMGMVTVYHLNGDRLILTHYCSAGNQPRLVATDFSNLDKKISFKYLDITNGKFGDGHISSLEINFSSDTKIIETWGYMTKEKESFGTFELNRSPTSNTESGHPTVVWFEIPVTNMERAVQFYSQLFQIQLKSQQYNGFSMAFFPISNTKGAPGALIEYSVVKPSLDGSTIFFDGGDDLTQVLNRVEAAGGTILIAKTLISEDIGYFAQFKDTEGNRISLYSKN